MNKKSVKERARIVQLLVEGNSIRSTSRIADCSINTVLKLLVDVGAACETYQHDHLVNLPCKRIQIDEIWSFCHTKDKHRVYEDDVSGRGSIWTFTSICPDTKIVPCWLVGGRNAYCARQFVEDLSSRMSGKIQLTSDGYKAYIEPIEDNFEDVDYGILQKQYEPGTQKYVGSKKRTWLGSPDKPNLHTAHVERQNLTMRTNIKRFARKTNAHSKKIENHAYAVALHFMYYNFARIHSSLRVTPAMAAGVCDHVWSLEEMVELII